MNWYIALMCGSSLLMGAFFATFNIPSVAGFGIGSFFGFVLGMIFSKSEATKMASVLKADYEARFEVMQNALRMATEEALAAKDGMSRLAQLRRIFATQSDVDSVLQDLADAFQGSVDAAIEAQQGTDAEKIEETTRELTLAKSEFWDAIHAAMDCGYIIRMDENGGTSWKLYARDEPDHFDRDLYEEEDPTL